MTERKKNIEMVYVKIPKVMTTTDRSTRFWCNSKMVYTNTSIYRDNDRLSTNCMCVDALIIIYESTVMLLSARWPKCSTMY